MDDHATQPTTRLQHAAPSLGTMTAPAGAAPFPLAADVASQRFRAAMDATAEAIFLTDRATMQIVDVNRAACELLGRSRDELVGMGPEKILNVERARLERLYDDVIAGTAPAAPWVIEQPLSDGTKRTVEFRRRAYQGAAGWLIVTVASDVTARVEAERALRVNVRRQEVFARFGHLALKTPDLQGLLVAAARAASEGLGADLCAVFRWMPATRSLLLAAGTGWHPSAIGTMLAPRESDAATGADDGGPESFAFADPGEAGTLDRVHRDHEVASGIEVLVGVGNDAFGLLGCYWRRPRQASQAEIDFLYSIANALDIAIERRDATVRLARMASFDSLTGLANRERFREALVEHLAATDTKRHVAAVLYIDLDGFKAVNDTHGHGAGDQLLKAVSTRLQACVGLDDTIGRLGGDEFAIVVTNLDSADDAQRVAGRVVAELAQPFDLDSGRVLVTASIGIAVYPFDGEDADALIRNSDSAMYQGKEHGRNNFQNYSLAIDAAASERRRLAADLRNAIERQEFELHYQPQVELHTGDVVGVEAMLRWWHPTRGLMLASEFIRLAEESGELVRITNWIVETACQQAAAWQREGLAKLSVAVNFSPFELANSDVPHQVEGALRRSGLEPRRLEVEVPGWTTPAQRAPFATCLSEFSRLGVAIAIDDYGGGCASLATLREFPLAKLKIDAAFTRGIATSHDDRVILKTIVAMAKQLGFSVVAKEVETIEQMEALRRCGCDFAQGFLFGAPLPAFALGELLEAANARRLQAVLSPDAALGFVQLEDGQIA